MNERNIMINKIICPNCNKYIDIRWKYCAYCGRETIRNITEECTIELVKSAHSNGYYCSIFHKGKSILALGLDNKSKIILKTKKYRVIKAKDATISFNIFTTGDR